MGMNIIEFLEARIAEDEASALVHRVGAASLTADWHTETHYGEVLIIDAYGVVVSKAGRMSQHIARHDPARVLRECAAKRAMLKRAAEDAAVVDGEWGCNCATDDIRTGRCSGNGSAYFADWLMLLAAPYAHHPDYREEWRA